MHGLKAGTGDENGRKSDIPSRSTRAHRQRRRTWKLDGAGADHVPVAVLAEHGVASTRCARGGSGRAAGLGEIQDFFELPQLNALNADAPAAHRAPCLEHDDQTSAILFDLDGTLVDTREASWELFQETNRDVRRSASTSP